MRGGLGREEAAWCYALTLCCGPNSVVSFFHGTGVTCSSLSLLTLMAETKALSHMGVSVPDTARAVLEQVSIMSRIISP